MKSNPFNRKSKFTLFFVLTFCSIRAQNFTSGNLVVLRIDNGTDTIATPMTLLEYATTGGSPTKTLSLSATGTDKITVVGSTKSEGQLSLSQNGFYLSLIGYDQLAGTGRTACQLAANKKVIARIDNAGNIDWTTKFPTSSVSSAKSVCSKDGLNFWTSINNIGYVGLGQTTAPTSIVNNSQGRVAAILNNQLYTLRGFSDLVYTTTALPTATSTTATAMSLSTKLDASGFVFFDSDANSSTGWNGTGYELLYVSNANSGVEKYYFDGAYWKVANSQYNLKITITNGGTGYTTPPTVSFGTPWQANTTYAANVSVSYDGRLYNVKTAGTVGATPPTHTSGDATPSGGTTVYTYLGINTPATATISGGVVTSIDVTVQYGYVTPLEPALSISGGGGTGATATAALSNNHYNPTVGGVQLGGLSQMVGQMVGGKPTLYAVSGNGTAVANKIYVITDNAAYNAPMSGGATPYSTLVTATSTQAFRGISFAPAAANALITVTGTTTPFTTETGLVSAEQSYSVSGSGLTAAITITAPTGFEISTTSGSGFAGSLTLAQSGGNVNSTTIFIRLKNVATTGTPSGNITHSSSGAVPKTLAVSGTVVPTTAPVNYYVSPTGSNSNDGLTPATPFQTLSKFSNNTTLIKGGDIIYLMDGTFGPTDLAVGNTHTQLEITRSGEPGKPIKFTKYPGANPLIQFNGWNAILIKASYIEIDGLKIRGANSVLTLANALNQGKSCANPNGVLEGKYNGNGIHVDGRIIGNTTAHPVHVTIKNCEVYECGGGGIATSEVDYLILENNITYNCAWYSIYANSGLSVFHGYNSDNNTTDYKTIIRNNISYGNEQRVPWPDASCKYTDGNGIIIDDFRNTQGSSTIRGQVYTGKILVENNLVYNNGGRGVHAYYADNCTFINNTSYNNNATADINEGEITIVSSNNCRVFGNILYARTGKKGNSYSGGSVGLQAGNNIIYNYTGTLGFGNATNGDMLGVDPQFVSAGTNFQLQSTSPAIDAGSALTGLFSTKDLVGSTRPYNNVRSDMGAYESTHTGSVLSTLTATISSPNNMICSGQDAVFNLLGTSGATLTYKINSGSNTTIVLTGGTATLTIPAVTTSQTMTLVSITNGGSTQAFTNTISSYQVTVTPSVGGTIKATTAACAGSNSTPLTLLDHRGVVVRWESSTDNFATAATPITSSLTTFNAENLTTTTYYRAVLQNGSCPAVNSAIMPVIINALPTITGRLSALVSGTTQLTGSGTGTTWASATPSVATVSNTGVVTGVALGASVITYTDQNNCAQTATVNIVTVLPVELLHFTATPLEKNVNLFWATASEKNSSHYEIEHSKDGQLFTKIGSVKGSNNSVIKQSYEFLDEKAVPGMNYYRLKMVDNDGKFEYSPYRTAFIAWTETVIAVYPNPVSEASYLNITSPQDGSTRIRLYNSQGQMLRQFTPSLKAGENAIRIDMADLVAGMYYLSLEVNHKSYSVKIRKD